MVITALTDNVNRAIADVKTVWRKHGLKQAAQGSVMFQFAKKGRVEVQGTVDEEQVRFGRRAAGREGGRGGAAGLTCDASEGREREIEASTRAIGEAFTRRKTIG